MAADFELTESDRQEIQRLVTIESFKPIVDSLTDSTKDLVKDLEDVFREAAKMFSESFKGGGTGGGDENKPPSENKPSPGGGESKFNLANIYSRHESGAGAAASGDLVGLAGMAPAIGGPLGILGAMAFGTAGALAGLTKVVQSAAKEYSAFSPSLAITQAQSDIRAMFRDMNIGEQIAPEIAEFTKALDDLKDAAAPVTVAFTKLAAIFSTQFFVGAKKAIDKPEQFGGAVLETISSPQIEFINQASNFLGGDPEAGTKAFRSVTQWAIDQMSGENVEAPKRNFGD